MVFTKILDMLGATVKDSVSSSVDYLIVGFAPGGKKLADAMRLGVQVISYGDFLTKLGTPIKWQSVYVPQLWRQWAYSCGLYRFY